MKGEVKEKYMSCGDTSNAFYGLGLIGALVFYIEQASGFWEIILAILKAIVWPAFFVYDAFKFML
jgi:hypothetical protein